MLTSLILLGLQNLALASSPTVSIDSFYYTGKSDNNAAELCGTVRPSTDAIQHVTVTVDPKSKRPAKYVVATHTDGAFCTLVMTITGTASAQVTGERVASSTAAVGSR